MTFPDPSIIASARQVAQAWKALGCSNAVIIGMGVTQADAESQFNPNALGDFIDANGNQLPWSPNPVGTPTAFSMYQVHPDRCGTIKAAVGFDLQAGALAKTNTIEQCVEAAWWELMHIPYLGWAEISVATTPCDAAIAACQFFERAASPADKIARGQIAERWAAVSGLLGL